jgi:hypothetical protein
MWPILIGGHKGSGLHQLLIEPKLFIYLFIFNSKQEREKKEIQNM